MADGARPEPRREARAHYPELDGPPAVRGQFPDEVQARAWIRDHVLGLRGRGVGWQNIARIVGKPERWLREHYEPLIGAAPAAAPPPSAVARPATWATGALRTAVLVALESMPGADAPEVAEAIGHQARAVGGCLRALRRDGVARDLGGAWLTTAAGRAELARREAA